MSIGLPGPPNYPTCPQNIADKVGSENKAKNSLFETKIIPNLKKSQQMMQVWIKSSYLDEQIKWDLNISYNCSIIPQTYLTIIAGY